jgi:chromatin assembly factor 1 subunit B
MTALPPVAAGGVPLFTPPQTPGHHVNGSTSSIAGMVPPGAKRESNASVESVAVASNVAAGVKRPSVTSDSGETERTDKKRRIAPTLVSGNDGSAASSSEPPGEKVVPTTEAG